MVTIRPRTVRSSSQGDMGAFNQIRPIESPVALFDSEYQSSLLNNVKAKEEQPRQIIWTLGSPVNDYWQSKKKGPEEGFCEFLKACSLCKKKLGEGKDVYMYGYLRAFCSPQCREDQIALDGFDKEISTTSHGKKSTKDHTSMGLAGLNRCNF